ncbi:hypothetical protein RRG08_065831 [Elysia crispata]|uniref:PiggyBac transposable element-derived protein domain-containing protein n=1 Tax=Elysia crispata TaxID=231223 RepID=A0AAE1B0M0_9GAST|nr:hypothetical protein RRG08_065831 [Elysia crispata]
MGLGHLAADFLYPALHGGEAGLRRSTQLELKVTVLEETCSVTTVTVGATVPEHARPVQYFSLFWDDGWWDHLSAETNRYARSQNPPADWTPVTVNDMKVFIGLCFGTGIIKLPCLSNYWRQKKRLFQTELPSVMSRDRFLAIWPFAHVADKY